MPSSQSHSAESWGEHSAVFPKKLVVPVPQPSQAPSFSALLLGLSVPSGSPSTPQKRDIQLLKAYMRAIRSVNPNLQNLEETIEYNEILE